jgi:hypothetical protein
MLQKLIREKVKTSLREQNKTVLWRFKYEGERIYAPSGFQINGQHVDLGSVIRVKELTSVP